MIRISASGRESTVSVTRAAATGSINLVPAEHPAPAHRLVEATMCPRAPVACDLWWTATGPGPGRQVMKNIAPAIIPGGEDGQIKLINADRSLISNLVDMDVGSGTWDAGGGT